MLNKDVVHAKMRRRIENPRIVLLDCNLEYKKGESQTNIELSKETDFASVSHIGSVLFYLFSLVVNSNLILIYN